MARLKGLRRAFCDFRLGIIKRLCYTDDTIKQAERNHAKMENKLKVLKTKKAQKLLCYLRGLIGETILAALAMAYIAEHINQIPHQAAVTIAVVVIGLVLYFAHSNKVK